jgi:hypothetical protein
LQLTATNVLQFSSHAEDAATGAQDIRVSFEVMDLGDTEIDSYTYKDVRDKGTRSLPIKIV